MIKLNSAVIVEGKYDKIRLQSVVDAPIIATNGFGIFKNAELRALIKRLAEESGIIILTDSDSAGTMIRNHIKSFVDEKHIINVYAPTIKGKERRKQSPGKEGVLGVEGIDSAVLEQCFLRAGVQFGGGAEREKVTNADLFELGFSGRENSKAARERLLKFLLLPQSMSAPSMLTAINALYEREEFLKLAAELLAQN